MKKLIALAVAIVMMAALAVPAFAENATINQDSADKTADMTVTYEPSASYTVTLPDSAAIGGTAEVSVDEAVLAADTQIKITVAPKTGEAWVLTNSASETLNYTIKNGNAEIAVNGTVLTHAAGATVPTDVTLSFALEDGQTAKATSYTQVITFNVAVESTTQA